MGSDDDEFTRMSVRATRSQTLGCCCLVVLAGLAAACGDDGDDTWVGLPYEAGDLAITVDGALVPEPRTLHGFCQIGFNNVNLGTGPDDLSLGLNFILKRGENQLPLRLDDDHAFLNAELGTIDYAGESVKVELEDGGAHAGRATATLISDQAPTTAIEVEWQCSNFEPWGDE